MTTRTFRPDDPEELWLLPPSPRDWLPEDHLAYFLSDLVDELDLKAILATYWGVTRGNAPYDPRMLVTILLYAYAVGMPASRQIARELEEDVAVRVLAANQRPDFRMISDVRKQHLTALADLFVQVLKLCQRAGLVKLGHIALDGTKVQANASKHKAMSDSRMVTEEARLQTAVEALLQRAEAADAQDDAVYGPDRRGDELPPELARREQRLETSRAAKARLEQEAQAEAALTQAAREAGAPDRPRRGRPPQPLRSGPPPKAQRNITDPESRIMPAPGAKGSVIQGYNCQAAVDAAAQIIVAAEVTAEANDTQQAQPLRLRASRTPATSRAPSVWMRALSARRTSQPWRRWVVSPSSRRIASFTDRRRRWRPVVGPQRGCRWQTGCAARSARRAVDGATPGAKRSSSRYSARSSRAAASGSSCCAGCSRCAGNGR